LDDNNDEDDLFFIMPPRKVKTESKEDMTLSSNTVKRVRQPRKPEYFDQPPPQISIKEAQAAQTHKEATEVLVRCKSIYSKDFPFIIDPEQTEKKTWPVRDVRNWFDAKPREPLTSMTFYNEEGYNRYYYDRKTKAKIKATAAEKAPIVSPKVRKPRKPKAGTESKAQTELQTISLPEPKQSNTQDDNNDDDFRDDDEVWR
jgi:DNA polymerase sigma